VGGDRPATAAKKVADRSQVSVGVRGSQGVGALNEAAKDLGSALGEQLGRLDDDAAAVGQVGAPAGEAVTRCNANTSASRAPSCASHVAAAG
jgi:hypothetical protein